MFESPTPKDEETKTPPSRSGCLGDNTLYALSEGQLSERERKEATRHLDTCETCRQLLAALGHALSPPGETQNAAHDKEPAPSPQLAGSRIGRYTILHWVGAGGMGIVYAAYDPELDRRVALKLVHPNRLPNDTGNEVTSRLLREARALGRLAHPHVVTVFDAGRFESQVFLAMEFVDGGTLGQWLRTAERTPAEVLVMFLAAGRGLAAAHEAGLVHRDFKPDNVLIGKDGRARVTDFGLARVATSQDEMPSEDNPTPTSLAAGTNTTTRTGALLGTPPYMAPELWGGAPADSRSDQFAFCVALYEALEGERPFSVAALKGAADTESNLQTLRPRRVPLPWQRALLRGLDPSPARRFPSMNALIAALENGNTPPRSKRARLALFLGLGGLVLLSAGVVRGAFRARPEAVCTHAPERLVGVWDDTRKQEIRKAFLATQLTYAQAAFAGTERLLDQYTNRWIQMHTEACEATHLRGEQSGELLDLRMDCLAKRRESLNALTTLFASAEESVVARAAEATSQLQPLDECASREALSAPIKPPQEPAKRAELEATREKLARADALHAAGRYQDSLTLAEESLTSARGLGYNPLKAEASITLAGAFIDLNAGDKARAALVDALSASLASGDILSATRATVSLAFVDGLLLRHHAQGHVWLELSAGTQERVGPMPQLTAERFFVLGRILQDEGKAEEATPHLERALHLQESVLGPDHPDVAKTLDGLARALATLERTADALKSAKRGLSIMENLVGPEHPECVRPLHTMGFVFALADRSPEAVPFMERALRIEERAFGPNHPVLVKSLINLSNMQTAAEAIVLLKRALEIQERAGNMEQPDSVLILKNLAISEGLLRQDREQEDHARRALAMEEKLLGPLHPELGMTLLMLGQATHRLGRTAEALPFLERAFAVTETRSVKDFYLAGRDVQAAIRIALADVLWTLGRDKTRARQLVSGALVLVQGGEKNANLDGLDAECSTWLSAHPLTERAGR